MANIITHIDPASTMISIQNAFINKYGEDNVSIKYISTSVLILSCPKVLDKIIRFEVADKIITIKIGDWESGSSLKNAYNVIYVSVHAENSVSGKLILGDDFFVLNSGSSYPSTAICGKLTNDIFVIFSAVNDTAYYRSYGYRTDTMNAISPISFSIDFCSNNNSIYVQPLLIKDTSDNRLLFNSDGSYATFSSIYSASTKQNILTDDTFMCYGPAKVNSTTCLYTSIYVPITSQS